MRSNKGRCYVHKCICACLFDLTCYVTPRSNGLDKLELFEILYKIPFSVCKDQSKCGTLEVVRRSEVGTNHTQPKMTSSVLPVLFTAESMIVDALQSVDGIINSGS